MILGYFYIGFELKIVTLLFTVSKFANDKIRPLVLEMDRKSEMSGQLIQELFDNGVSK